MTRATTKWVFDAIACESTRATLRDADAHD